MHRRRWFALLALLAALAAVGIAPTARAATGAWLPAGQLIENRAGHTASALQNGEVLIAGGAGRYTLATTERFDPATNRWRPSAAMATARVYHTATTLADGRVLVTGGATGFGYPATDGTIYASAEIYDPVADRWSPAAPLSRPREHHTATLLRDGRVLVAGGVTHKYDGGDFSATDATAEIYDPRTDTWTSAGTMPGGHSAHAAVLLDDGDVLIIAGWPNGDILSFGRTVDRYDPATNSWRAAASLLSNRGPAVATTLADGRVLVAGGANEGNGRRTAERYDPLADRWEPAGVPGETIWPGTATRLANGRVLVTGGFDYARAGTQGLATIYDPGTNSWSALPDMRVFRSAQTATLLADGRVLVAGGGNGEATAETYLDSDATAQCFPESGKCLRGTFLAFWLAHGGLAINGYPLTDEFDEALDVPGVGTQTFRVQYLERVRLELHTDSAGQPYVALGQFGRAIHPADPPVAAIPGASYFADTGHNVTRKEFLDYWNDNGGLPQFGFPLTEEFEEMLPINAQGDLAPFRVQYFERARFEYHPENRPPFSVLLGQFGRRIMAERGIQP